MPDKHDVERLPQPIQPTDGCPWRYTDCNGPSFCMSGDSCKFYLEPKNYDLWKFLMRWVIAGRRPGGESR